MHTYVYVWGFPGGTVVKKESPANAEDTRDTGSIPGSGRSPGGGNSNPLQYSCLEHLMERSLADYSPWGPKKLYTTEWLSTAPSPGACSNSCPLSQWGHPTISSSGIPFSSCPQSLPASGSFPMNWLCHIRWPNYWSFSFSISPCNEYSGLISFRMDWFDLLAVQGTFKSLLQHHSSNTWILWCSAFFMVQLSHPYMTTGETIVLIRWTFVSKVMSLLFHVTD